MTIDVGTGDGRAVLARAAAEPTTLALGIDASAPAMAESSRRAARAAAKGGLPNARFIMAAAEDLPPELAGLAELVTVVLPWGSLLRGCLGAEPDVARGLASILAAGGRLELLLAPSERDHLAPVPGTVAGIEVAVRTAFEPFGLGLELVREATTEEVRRSRSSWASRLLRRSAAGGRASVGRLDRRVVLVRLRSSR